MSWSVTAEYMPTLTETSPKDREPFQEGRGTAATSDHDAGKSIMPLRRVPAGERSTPASFLLVRIGRGVGLDGEGARLRIGAGDVVATVKGVVTGVALLEPVQ